MHGAPGEAGVLCTRTCGDPSATLRDQARPPTLPQPRSPHLAPAAGARCARAGKRRPLPQSRCLTAAHLPDPPHGTCAQAPAPPSAAQLTHALCSLAAAAACCFQRPSPCARPPPVSARCGEEGVGLGCAAPARRGGRGWLPSVRSCRRSVEPQMEPSPGAAGRGGRRTRWRAGGGSHVQRRARGAAAAERPLSSPLPPPPPRPAAARLARASCGKSPPLSAAPSHTPARRAGRAAPPAGAGKGYPEGLGPPSASRGGVGLHHRPQQAPGALRAALSPLPSPALPPAAVVTPNDKARRPASPQRRRRPLRDVEVPAGPCRHPACCSLPAWETNIKAKYRGYVVLGFCVTEILSEQLQPRIPRSAFKPVSLHPCNIHSSALF